MQYYIIFLAVAALFLLRKLKIRSLIKIIVLLIVSGFAFVFSFLVMIQWSKIPYEFHQLLCEQFYTKKKSEQNFVIADVTVHMKTAYNLTHNMDYEVYSSYMFYYMHKNKSTLLKQKFETIDSFKKSEIYNNMLADLPSSFNVDSLDNISGVCYNFPSWTIIQPQKMKGNGVAEHQRNDSNYGIDMGMCETWLKDEKSKAASMGKLYYNQQQNFILTKGVSNTIHSVPAQRKQKELSTQIMLNKFIWFFSANDLSRTNYIFDVQHSGIDSLNLMVRFDEAVDVQEHWVKELGRSPYFVRYAFHFDDNSRSRMVFSVKNIESDNIQQIRMFLVTTLCLLFGGMFVKLLLLGGGYVFKFNHGKAL